MKPIFLISALLVLSVSTICDASDKKTGGEKTIKSASSATTNEHALTLVYLTTKNPEPVTRPFFDPAVNGEGIQGAALGIDDNNTTGQFTGQSFILKTVIVEDPTKLEIQFRNLLADKQSFFLIDLPAEAMLLLSKIPEARNSLLMDLANGDNRLRGEDCQQNVFFLMPSDAMRSDALAQYFGKKRWQKWFLVTGQSEGDRRFADSLRHSAKKFGAKIVKDSIWAYSFDDRRSPESEIPVFTQGDDYDVLLVADTQHQFADLFPYRTWQSKVVAGNAGLTADAWHKTHEAWGALQLQNRFRDKFARPMLEKDYLGWLAARSFGEASTRAHSTKSDDIKRLLLDPSFSVAGFKGVPLSFRSWDHQMRQPILLGAERSVVSVAPIDGYLHPQNTLDTLGNDAPESSCVMDKATTSPPP